MLCAVIGKRCYDEFGTSLTEHFGSLFVLPPDTSVAPEVADHPDMILSFVGDALVIPRGYYDANRELCREIADASCRRTVLSDAPRSKDYPHDIGMNALVTGRHLFGRLSYVSPEVLTLAGESGLSAIDVKQGYAACSALSCGDVIITGDASIKQAAEANGYGVIFTDTSGIKLDGYSHGFIGGSGGIFGNTAYFLGDPSSTPGTESLTAELSRHGISSVALSGSCLTDYGGIKIFKM